MIRIVSDSSTLYSIKEARDKNIEIAPLSVAVDGKSFKEIEEINTKQLVDKINEGFMPTSSQPSVGDIVNIYEQYKDDEIINISMADGLSGTYNAACLAKQMEEHNDKIHVINSKTLCGPQRYLVEAASKMVSEGKNVDEIIKNLNDLIETSISFLMPRDFDYLVRGGRLSKTAGKIGTLIKMIPIMTLSQDSKSLIRFKISRTFSAAIKSICEYYKAKGVNEDYKIYITHACNEELAEAAKNIIINNMGKLDMEILELSPVFTIHGGPECIAVQTIKKYK